MELGHGFEEAFTNSVSIGDDVPPERLTVESISLLDDGISLILAEWIPLRRAVSRDLQLGGTSRKEFLNSTGVRLKTKKVDEIHSEIFNWFTQSKVPHCPDALRQLLFRTMLAKYKTYLADGSPHKIACKLMDLYKECLQKSASRRGGEEASLKCRRLGQGRRAYGERHTPY